MDVSRINELQHEIARAAIDDAPDAEGRLLFEFVAVGGYGVGGVLAERGGSSELVADGGMALVHSADLQDAMFERGRGTWLSMRCVIDPPGEYHFSFNYDEPVEFDEYQEILDSSWVREFKRHPRPWALIPEWNYVKKAFTEAEWAEQVAEFERTGKHTDS